jgi:hypothetical protein
MRYILRRFAWFAAFIGLAAWAIGTITVLWTANAELFQRFGALGVAASVLFFTDRLAKIELGRQKSVEKLLHEYGIELTAMKQGTRPQDIPQEGYAVDFLTEERNFDSLRQQAEMFNLLNVLLLTAATLQWGFGDRIVNQMLLCGSPQC